MKGMYTTLVKRELWEHRWLWLGPAAAAVLQLCLFLVVAVMASQGRMQMGGDFRSLVRIEPGLIGVMAQLSFISFFVMVFYLLDSLYAERKDRSILFWKSLPVSDFQTVVTKFGVGMVLLPVATFLLATVTFPLIYAIMATGVPGFSGVTGGWSFSEWFRAEFGLLGSLVVSILWYAPLAGWCLLASILTNRSGHILVGLPVVVLGVGETVLFRTKHVWEFLRSRVIPIESFQEGIQRPSLWIGLAVAAGMLYIVIRVRRYRDDT